MNAETATTKTPQMHSRRFGGDYLDDRTLRNYNLTPDCIGQYAIIQHGYACLGVGDTPNSALADAEKCIGESVELVDDHRADDGECECVLIEEDK
ncbi:MAG: hypothetical protein WC373_14910 [Smithella sp.]|jgi:hypothetical protein